MSKTSKNVRVNKSNKNVVAPVKRTHLSMKAFDACNDHVVKVQLANKTMLVKSDRWYVARPENEGDVGYPRVHCLVKKGVALFASEKNYMRPRMYKPVNEVIDVATTVLVRTL